jgi:hypothetical protein
MLLPPPVPALLLLVLLPLRCQRRQGWPAGSSSQLQVHKSQQQQQGQRTGSATSTVEGWGPDGKCLEGRQCKGRHRCFHSTPTQTPPTPNTHCATTTAGRGQSTPLTRWHDLPELALGVGPVCQQCRRLLAARLGCLLLDEPLELRLACCCDYSLDGNNLGVDLRRQWGCV